MTKASKLVLDVEQTHGRKYGTDRDGSEWLWFEVDSFAGQEPGTCENCQNHDLTEGWMCLDGGHERCESCVRERPAYVRVCTYDGDDRPLISVRTDRGTAAGVLRSLRNTATEQERSYGIAGCFWTEQLTMWGPKDLAEQDPADALITCDCGATLSIPNGSVYSHSCKFATTYERGQAEPRRARW